MGHFKDIREHLSALEREGLLVQIDRSINKDTELHPLVRLQFRGLPESERKAFIFTNVTDVNGRKFGMPVVVGHLAASRRIYALGMQCEPDRIVDCSIASNISAECDPRLMKVVLENLINNAWKFTSKQELAHIDFGMTDDSEHGHVYFVRDNGAGFDMAYVNKLFGAFQRLHSTTEFPGTGIGLATVQRIIHRHGGRTWAQGQVDHGATFYFSLPATDGSVTM